MNNSTIAVNSDDQNFFKTTWESFISNQKIIETVNEILNISKKGKLEGLANGISIIIREMLDVQSLMTHLIISHISEFDSTEIVIPMKHLTTSHKEIEVVAKNILEMLKDNTISLESIEKASLSIAITKEELKYCKITKLTRTWITSNCPNISDEMTGKLMETFGEDFSKLKNTRIKVEKLTKDIHETVIDFCDKKELNITDIFFNTTGDVNIAAYDDFGYDNLGKMSVFSLENEANSFRFIAKKRSIYPDIDIELIYSIIEGLPCVIEFTRVS